jgi:hypothetical protein
MTRAMSVARFGIASATLLLLAASLCGCQGSDAEKLGRARKELTAWRATVGIAAKEYVDDRVPRTYLRQVVKAADESLAQREKDLKSISDAGIKAELRSLRRTLSDVSGALEQKDAAQVMRATAVLRTPSAGGSGGGG